MKESGPCNAAEDFTSAKSLTTLMLKGQRSVRTKGGGGGGEGGAIIGRASSSHALRIG